MRAAIFSLIIVVSACWGCAPAEYRSAKRQELVDLGAVVQAGAKKVRKLLGEGGTEAVPVPEQMPSVEGSTAWELAKRGKVVPGMTKQHVLLAKGKPEAVNVIEGGWGTTEQWVYGGYRPEFVYITNGRVTSR